MGKKEEGANVPLWSMENVGVSVCLNWRDIRLRARSARPAGPNSLLVTLPIMEAARGSLDKSDIKDAALGSFEQIRAPSKASASFKRCSSALRYLFGLFDISIPHTKTTQANPLGGPRL